MRGADALLVWCLQAAAASAFGEPGEADAGPKCWQPPKLDPAVAEPGDDLTMMPGSLVAGVVSDEKAAPFPRHVPCPSECSYSQLLAGHQCYKACVQPESCRLLHPVRTFADPDTSRCTATCGSEEKHLIMGCDECSGVGVCARCKAWHTVSADGKICKSKLRHVWWIIYGFLAFTSFFLALYVFRLSILPSTNEELLRHADAHRKRCRPKQICDDNVWRSYPLFHTAPYREDISGVGVMLYFRWVLFMVVISAFLAIFMYLSYNYGLDHKGNLTSHNDDCGALEGVANVSTGAWNETAWEEEATSLLVEGDGTLRHVPRVKMKSVKHSAGWHDGVEYAGSEADFQRRMAISTGISYLVVSIASLWFGKKQKEFVTKWDGDNSTHKDYVLHVTGLPPHATDPLELEQFFKDVLDMERAAQKASLRKDGSPVDTQNTATSMVVSHRSRSMTSSSALASSDGKESEGEESDDEQDLQVVGVSIAYCHTAHAKEVEEAINDVIEELESDLRRRVGHSLTGSFVTDISGELSIAQAASSGSKVTSKRSKRRSNTVERINSSLLKGISPSGGTVVAIEEMQAMLQDVPCAGDAYIVLSSERAADMLKAAFAAGTVARTYQGHPLTFRRCDCEPPDIIWENHGRTLSVGDLLWSFAGVPLTMIGWGTCYLPYAFYYTSVTKVPGQHVTLFQDLVLGALIAGGNLLVATAIDVAVDSLAFTEKDVMDCVTLALAYMATVVNTACDFMMVIVIVNGVLLDLAFKGAVDGSDYNRVFARELYSLLVPGYLILPLLVRPVFEDILPHFVYVRLIRSSQPGEITRRDAERLLMHPDFDITWRYAEILNNFTVCFVVFFFSTPNIYWIMGWVIVFLLLSYAIDQYKLVREATATFYTTDALSTAFSYWWMIPSGLLGCSALFWGFKSGMVTELYWTDFGLFMLVHGSVFSAVLYTLRQSVPPPPNRTLLYEEMRQEMERRGEVYTYVNTNKIHVLRSWFMPPSHLLPRMIPFAKGKEHLHTDAHRFQLGTTRVTGTDGVFLEVLAAVAHLGDLAFGEDADPPPSNRSSRSSLDEGDKCTSPSRESPWPAPAGSPPPPFSPAGDDELSRRSSRQSRNSLDSDYTLEARSSEFSSPTAAQRSRSCSSSSGGSGRHAEGAGQSSLAPDNAGGSASGGTGSIDGP